MSSETRCEVGIAVVTPSGAGWTTKPCARELPCPRHPAPAVVEPRATELVAGSSSVSSSPAVVEPAKPSGPPRAPPHWFRPNGCCSHPADDARHHIQGAPAGPGSATVVEVFAAPAVVEGEREGLPCEVCKYGVAKAAEIATLRDSLTRLEEALRHVANGACEYLARRIGSSCSPTLSNLDPLCGPCRARAALRSDGEGGK